MSTMRYFFPLLVLLALLLPAEAANRALVVGIDSYPHLKMGPLGTSSDLRGAVNDARTMAELVASAFDIPHENVLLLTNERATRQGILDAFRAHLIEGTAEGDQAVFYYAGHGAQVLDGSGDELSDALDEVLVPHDARADLSDPDTVLDNAVSDDEIEALVKELKKRFVTVIIDACHSGTITRSALAARKEGPRPAYKPYRTITPHGPLRLRGDLLPLAGRLAHRNATRFLSSSLIDGTRDGPRLAVWSAVGAAEFALEDMSIGGAAGLFTSRFVRGVGNLAADRNGNGVVTAAELLAYLREETQSYCKAYDCLAQNPTPRLEAYPGYEAAVLSDAGASSYPVALLDTIAGQATAVRATPDAGSAIPADVLPAQREKAVTLRLESGKSMPVGAALTLTIHSEVAGRLVVIDRKNDGTVVQLFPNDYALAMGEAEMIAAGESRTLPGKDAGYAFSAEDVGSGAITALVLDPAVDVAALLAAYSALQPVAHPEDYSARISRALSRAIILPTGSEAALETPAMVPTLARADAAYEIVEK